MIMVVLMMAMMVILTIILVTVKIIIELWRRATSCSVRTQPSIE